MTSPTYRPYMLRPPSVSVENRLSLPHNFIPRQYQIDDLFRPMFPHHYPDLRVLGVQPKTRICTIWHRRAGKDKSLLNVVAIAAWETPGNYLYLLPEQTQAKKIIWRGMDKEGFRFLDHIPEEIRAHTFASELLIELKNGSTIQIGGADNYNAWMGTNPRGIVFSEFSLQDPMAWQYFRPILVENGGWAVFNYTARGKNHGYDLHRLAMADPARWHHSLKTIDDTRLLTGEPVITQAQYQQEITDGMPEAIARQEFYCDFEASLGGSYYGKEMADARSSNRIGFFPYDPSKMVFTSWDVGLDANAVWFAQASGSGAVLIDHEEEENTKFSDMCKMITKKPYTYAAHFGPHDIKSRDPETDTRLNTAASYGIDFTVTPRSSRDEGIERTRQFIPRCRFNEDTTERGRDALNSYERVFDNVLKIFKNQPRHSWASHSADALRIMAVNWEEDMTQDSWYSRPLEVHTDII